MYEKYDSEWAAKLPPRGTQGYMCNIAISFTGILSQNKDQVAWLGRAASKGRLLLSGSIVLKWLEDAVT